MNHKNKLSPIASALGVTLLASLAAAPVSAEQNPFGMTEMSSGYMVAGAEGKCGEGKCGAKKKDDAKHAEGKCGEGKCGEGKCGADKKAGSDTKQGVAGKGGAEAKTAVEGKCGEGKCGADMKKEEPKAAVKK
ncbi:MAG: hypothetical protein H0W44_04415 [Gammaproteobacteria bacterium]|nr:hypothetical protein [Gammaproteobacteria bacterium]